MAEERRVPSKTSGQNICVENREKIKITGVNDVASFDESLVDAETELGRIIIRGEALKIAKLNLEENELILTGYVYSCEYDDKAKGTGKGVFSRMFK